MDDMTGEWIEEFEVKELLGSGAFGVTYLAYDTILDRDIVLKQIRHDEGAIDEARTLDRIDHPNVVDVKRVIEAHESHGYICDYIVMEHVEGSTLAEWFSERVLTQATWWTTFKRLLSAVHEVHASGLVHRDIKPDNVILRDSQPDQPVLIDFGLASTPGLSAWGGARGYAPPEAWHGIRQKRGDIYSLAVLSYEALFGPADDVAAMRARLQLEGGPFSNAIAGALSEDPDGRPSTILDFVASMVSPTQPNTKGPRDSSTATYPDESDGDSMSRPSDPEFDQDALEAARKELVNDPDWTANDILSAIVDEICLLEHDSDEYVDLSGQGRAIIINWLTENHPVEFAAWWNEDDEDAVSDHVMWTLDSKDSLAFVKGEIAKQSKVPLRSIGILIPTTKSADTGANQVGRLISDWEEYSWYDRLDDPERNGADAQLRELEKLSEMPSGSLVLRDEYEEYDADVRHTSVNVDYTATLASLRRD